MVEFIKEAEDKRSQDEILFDEFYQSTIVPMVEDDNKLKEKYRSKFWGYFWTVIFLMCINLLICCFSFLMYHRPINYEQIFLINMIGIIIICYPIYEYHSLPKQDVFETFLSYYGDWHHIKNSQIPSENSPIVPPHDTMKVKHHVMAEYADYSAELRDTVYQNISTFKNIHYKRKVSSGVVALIKFKQKFKGKVLLFERKGFYRKNKFPDLENVGNSIPVPIAELFHIFSDNVLFAKDMLPSLFFERILDLKDTFGAKCVYVEMCDDTLRMYFEGSTLYFDHHKIWNKKIDKNKFIQLHDEIEQTLLFKEMIQALRE
jgi:hypothetical protein